MGVGQEQGEDQRTDDHDHEANGDQANADRQAIQAYGPCNEAYPSNTRWLGQLGSEAENGPCVNYSNAWWLGGRLGSRLRACGECTDTDQHETTNKVGKPQPQPEA